MFFGNLDPEAYDRQYGDAQLVKRIARYFAAYRRKLMIIGVGVVITALFDTLFPVMISRGVNTLAERPSLEFLLTLIGVVFFSGVFSWCINYVRRRLTSQAVGDVILALRLDAFRATVAHDLSFYDEFKSGRIVSRITSDTQEFAQVVILV